MIKKEKFLALVTVFSVLVLFRPFYIDPDFGWHFRYGKDIYESNSIVKQNSYSYTMPDYMWANSYWLAQLIMYTTYTFVGPLALSLFSSIFFVYFVGKLSKNFSNEVAARWFALLIFFTLISAFSIVVRPLYFSSVFLVFLVYVLLLKRRYVIFLPLMFLLWANLHADMMLGLFIFGIYSLNNAYIALKEEGFSGKKLLKTFLPLSFSFLATFVNPYGIDLWLTLLNEISFNQFSTLVEWMPPTADNVTYFLVYYLSLLAVLVGGIKYRGKLGVWYLIVLLTFVLFSVQARYFMRVLLIIFLPVLFYFSSDVVKKTKSYLDKLTLKKINFALYLLLLITTFSTLPLVFNYMSSSQNVRSWSGEEGYPYGAVKYIKENSVTGNMFNDFAWGGYLIWQLPEHKTFIDGRMSNWTAGKEHVFKDYLNLATFPEENLYLIEYYDISWVLEKPGVPLVKYLRNRGDWKVTYEDEFAVLVEKQ